MSRSKKHKSVKRILGWGWRSFLKILFIFGRRDFVYNTNYYRLLYSTLCHLRYLSVSESYVFADLFYHLANPVRAAAEHHTLCFHRHGDSSIFRSFLNRFLHYGSDSCYWSLVLWSLKHSISLQEVLEYCTFVEPAEKCRRTPSYAEIPLATADMQRIEVMFNGCSHNVHSLSTGSG